jgi:hypothetical protein
MILERENHSIRRKICANVTLSTINPTLTEVDSNFGVLDKRSSEPWQPTMYEMGGNLVSMNNIYIFLHWLNILCKTP